MKHSFTILGGMGTIATESYVRLTNHRVRISKDQDYLSYILVNDAQIPDRTTYTKDHTKENFSFALKDDVEKQSLLKPDFFVMPCNTAHYFYHDLTALADIPFLNMMDTAVRHFMEEFPKEEKIGLTATEGSTFDKLYESSIVKSGRKVELGGDEIQPLVNELIYSDIKENGYVDGELYHRILRKMHDDYGCNVVLPGCTELSLTQEKAPNHPYNVVDPQSILAGATIELALKIRNGVDVSKAVSKCLYRDRYLSEEYIS